MSQAKMVAPMNFEEYRALQRPVVKIRTSAELLDFEMEILVSKGLARYEHADPFRKDPPSGLFLLVPPRTAEMNLAALMSLVVVGGKTGASYLSEGNLTEEIAVPPAPYLAVDVEDGMTRLNIKPSVSRAAILAAGRFPGLAYEGIIHCALFPAVLEDHFIDLLGSRYCSVARPCLYLLDGKPALNDHWLDNANPSWGAWSCGSRRGV